MITQICALIIITITTTTATIKMMAAAITVKMTVGTMTSNNNTNKRISYFVLRRSLVHRGLAESQVGQSPAAVLIKLSQTSHQHYYTRLHG